MRAEHAQHRDQRADHHGPEFACRADGAADEETQALSRTTAATYEGRGTALR
jgi:hypothetical protein